MSYTAGEQHRFSGSKLWLTALKLQANTGKVHFQFKEYKCLSVNVFTEPLARTSCLWPGLNMPAVEIVTISFIYFFFVCFPGQPGMSDVIIPDSPISILCHLRSKQKTLKWWTIIRYDGTYHATHGACYRCRFVQLEVIHSAGLTLKRQQTLSRNIMLPLILLLKRQALC